MKFNLIIFTFCLQNSYSCISLHSLTVYSSDSLYHHTYQQTNINWSLISISHLAIILICFMNCLHTLNSLAIIICSMISVNCSHFMYLAPNCTCNLETRWENSSCCCSNYKLWKELKANKKILVECNSLLTIVVEIIPIFSLLHRWIMYIRNCHFLSFILLKYFLIFILFPSFVFNF
jgi:hypothetical protein